MRKMKKWLALMVAGMMTVGVMGCSGSSDEGKKETDRLNLILREKLSGIMLWFLA